MTTENTEINSVKLRYM